MVAWLVPGRSSRRDRCKGLRSARPRRLWGPCWQTAANLEAERPFLVLDWVRGQTLREKIRSLVWFRLEAIMGLEESLRRATAVQAMPQNAARALKQGWSSADKMWRLAGDTATDYNHYTKRAILGSIYGATLAVFVADESEGKADTAAFLDRRIEGVMKFEKAKAQLLGKDREHFDFARFLGRLRYPQS